MSLRIEVRNGKRILGTMSEAEFRAAFQERGYGRDDGALVTMMQVFNDTHAAKNSPRRVAILQGANPKPKRKTARNAPGGNVTLWLTDTELWTDDGRKARLFTNERAAVTKIRALQPTYGRRLFARRHPLHDRGMDDGSLYAVAFEPQATPFGPGYDGRDKP